MAKKRIGDNPLDSIIPEQGGESGDRYGKTEKRNASKTAEEPNRISQQEKVKATYYMEADAEASLEHAWLKLRRLTGRKVSKSEIVEAAVRRVARDLDEGGGGSWIAQALK